MKKLDKVDLHQYQRGAAQHIIANESSMLWLGLGLGKALRHDQPVLTPHGWVRIDQLRVGDFAVGSDGKPVEIIGVYDQGVRDLACVKFNDGAQVICDWDHLWTVKSDKQRTRNKPGHTMTTKELLFGGVSNKHGTSTILKWTIPLVQPVQMAQKILPMQPYLLGVFLGDGTFSKTGSPSICTDLEIIHYEDVKLLRNHESATAINTGYGSMAKHKNVLQQLGMEGKRSWEKFVPIEYLTASAPQRLALLQGLLDTDGHAIAGGGVEFCSTSENLIDSVVALAQSLGGIGRKSSARKTNHQNGEGRTSWRVNVKLPSETNPFRLKRKLNKWQRPTKYHVIRKIESITPCGSARAVCIRVNADDHLFVTKDYIVTHNTVSTLYAFDLLQKLGQSRYALVVAPLIVCQLVWRQEGLKWSNLNHLTFSLMCGSEKKRIRALFRKADIYLINYESLSWLSIQLQHYFVDQGKPLPFDMLVFDEVSKVKRSVSKRFEAFAPISKLFDRKVGLTASPCSNGLHDLWAQFYMLDGGVRLGTNYPTFQSAFFHQVGNQSYSKWEPYSDTRAMIVNRISDITIEMKASDHLDMPALSIVDVVVTLPPAKAKLYTQLEKDFFIELENGGSIEVFNRAALCNKLLQFSNGIVYNYPDPDNLDIKVEEFVHDMKYKALADIISDSGDEPILLAYNFTSERREIEKRYPDAECLTGVDEEKAIDIMTRFNSGNIKLLIAHPLSAGHGINLQESCHIVVWFGLNYNLESYEQFIGRIARQGQTSAVQCFRIVTEDTMDYAVIEALSNKDVTQSAMRDAIGARSGKTIQNTIEYDEQNLIAPPPPPPM